MGGTDSETRGEWLSDLAAGAARCSRGLGSGLYRKGREVRETGGKIRLAGMLGGMGSAWRVAGSGLGSVGVAAQRRGNGREIHELVRVFNLWS